MRKVYFIGGCLAATLLSGCMTYDKPPIAVTKDSYTEVKKNEETLIPQNINELSLTQAQQIALANNPDFKSVRFAVDAARARYYQSYSSYAPTVDAGMSINQSFSKMYSAHNTTKSRSQSESYSPGLSGQLLVFDCLSREMNILSMKYSLKQSKETLEDSKRLLMRAVAYAYNDVLLALAQREISLAEIEYNKDMLEESEKKHKAGTALLSDVLNFRITLKNSQLDLLNSEYDIKANKYILAGYLGLTTGTLPGRIKFPKLKMTEISDIQNISAYLDQALANRPDLKAYRDQLKAAKYSYWSNIASAFGPSVVATYDLGYTQARSISHIDGGSSSNSKSGTGSLGYGISASWSLFNGFSDYFETKATLAEIAEVDYALAETWITVITDVRTAYSNYLANVQKARLSNDICQLTFKTRELVENEYKAGTALVTRLNEAERDLVDAQNNLITSLVNMANARAQLEAAVYSVDAPELNDESVNLSSIEPDNNQNNNNQ